MVRGNKGAGEFFLKRLLLVYIRMFRYVGVFRSLLSEVRLIIWVKRKSPNLLLCGLLLCGGLQIRADSKEEVFFAWDNMGRSFYRRAVKKELFARDGTRLSYTIFSPEKRGSVPVVISPGMGETGLFYTDMAYQLSQKGFGPFFVIDHRGNGRSQRFVDDVKVVHIENFESLVDDYAQFLDEVVFPFLRKGIL